MKKHTGKVEYWNLGLLRVELGTFLGVLSLFQILHCKWEIRLNGLPDLGRTGRVKEIKKKRGMGLGHWEKKGGLI